MKPKNPPRRTRSGLQPKFNLSRHRNGRYYVRSFAGGKEKWTSLKTKLLTVAKNRMKEHVDAFREALNLQLQDWRKLRLKFPGDEFFVLGDFNQDLAPTHYYGSTANRCALTAALEECGLVALTAGSGDPIRRGSPPFACIDHICMLTNSQWQAEPAVRWPDTPKPDKRLSDHFGLAVTLRPV